MLKRIVITKPVAQAGIDYLTDKGYEIKQYKMATIEEMAAEAPNCDAMLVVGDQVPAAVFNAGTRLKIVARHGAGVDGVDLAAAAKNNVVVTNTPGSNSNSVAEYTIAALHAAAKKFCMFEREYRKGDVAIRTRELGIELAGKTLGLVGFGHIGRLVAKKAAFGLDMKVIVFRHNLAADKVPNYVALVEWEDLFKAADYVSLHMPMRESTKNLVGTAEFDMMKRSAYLVNSARGGILDEEALTKALNNNLIAGAVLDVTKDEFAAPEDPLFHLSDVLLTPHIAAITSEAKYNSAMMAAEDIHRCLSGEAPLHEVKKQLF